MPVTNPGYGDFEKKMAAQRVSEQKKLIDTVIAPLVARVKQLEDTQRDSVKIKALEQEVAKQGSLLKSAQDHAKNQVPFQKAMMEKAVVELTHARLAQMDVKLSKTELLEARLKGMETMIRSMEQTIDMLQRKR